jgi:hypothetical protein
VAARSCQTLGVTKTFAVLDRLLLLRPFAFHTCGALNFSSIRNSRTLLSACSLLAGTPHQHLLTTRRQRSLVVASSHGRVEVRDNQPLRLGSLELEPGITLEQFLLELNSRVYLWPGAETGPISTGVAHLQHYQGEGAVRVIRVPLPDLLSTNPDRPLSVTFCNSGSARHHGGRKVLRGPGTFQPVHKATRPAGEVKELTFMGDVRLPESTVWGTNPSGRWQPL